MGTKAQPGRHDCYAKAEQDEPMFVLLARDSIAPVLVDIWVNIAELSGEVSPEKINEASKCAAEMRQWHKNNR